MIVQEDEILLELGRERQVEQRMESGHPMKYT